PYTTLFRSLAPGGAPGLVRRLLRGGRRLRRRAHPLRGARAAHRVHRADRGDRGDAPVEGRGPHRAARQAGGRRHARDPAAHRPRGPGRGGGHRGREQGRRGRARLLYPFVLSLLRDILAVVGVFLTLATMSPLAAVLVLVSLFPMLFASQRITCINARIWTDVGKLYWRSRYLHQHLVTTASSIELTSLGANRQISDKVTEAIARVTDRKAETYVPMLRWRL